MKSKGRGCCSTLLWITIAIFIFGAFGSSVKNEKQSTGVESTAEITGGSSKESTGTGKTEANSQETILADSKVSSESELKTSAVTTEREASSSESDTDSKVTVPEEEYKPIQRGSTGDSVIAVQKKLAALGFLKSAVDGSFGPGTEQAVKDFQNANQLEATGIIDKATYDAIASAEVKEHSASATVPSAEEILAQVEPYSGKPFCDIHNDVPYFADEEMTTVAFEEYGDLDSLGRCTTAYACVGPETLANQPRGEISEIKPTGWKNVRYAGIDQDWLYNRCHLIGFQLTGEDANEKNLITGTRYMNVEGMEPYEQSVADYVYETGYHVMYRVTPVFEGDNLVASGVLMEARSVEDPVIQYCVFCYNVQPGVTIDYRTGSSTGPEYVEKEKVLEIVPTEPEDTQVSRSLGQDYVVNTNTDKFHYPGCASVSQMKDKNRMDFTGTRDELIAMGYEPCKNCNP